MLKITLKNGCICKWEENEYSDYKYDGKSIVIIKDNKWVGFYNIDSVISVTVGK